MSIRARTSTKDNRQGGGGRRRTGGLLARPERAAPVAPEAPPGAPGPPPTPPQAGAGGKDLTDERRLRDSGGPEDRQLYACGCGFSWRGAVSASAACPHCGTEQAW